MELTSGWYGSKYVGFVYPEKGINDEAAQVWIAGGRGGSGASIPKNFANKGKFKNGMVPFGKSTRTEQYFKVLPAIRVLAEQVRSERNLEFA